MNETLELLECFEPSGLEDLWILEATLRNTALTHHSVTWKAASLEWA